jgi:peptide chain release factor 3
VRGASHCFDLEAYRAGGKRPVFFGLGDQQFRRDRSCYPRSSDYAPPPLARDTTTRTVDPHEPALRGFVFKIQANMDPGHRDRIAFMRICSGRLPQGHEAVHVRHGKEVRVGDAVTFLAADRQHTDEAWAGDIIGLHNHGTINIGDTLTEGERIMFTGIPNFRAGNLPPRRAARPAAHEGAAERASTSCARRAPRRCSGRCATTTSCWARSGMLQFDVVAFRLQDEYGVQASWDNVNVYTARWVYCADARKLQEFRDKAYDNLGTDHAGRSCTSRRRASTCSSRSERWPDVTFRETREHLAHAA